MGAVDQPAVTTARSRGELPHRPVEDERHRPALPGDMDQAVGVSPHDGPILEVRPGRLREPPDPGAIRRDHQELPHRPIVRVFLLAQRGETEIGDQAAVG